jgi:HPt (histidine-containing phosphotransfer) domain-containing protein
MRGAAANLGAQRLQNILAELEARSENGNPTALESLLKDARQEFENYKRAVKNFRIGDLAMENPTSLELNP